MASKSAYRAAEKGAEIEELLGELDKGLDRVKVLYEQYFMGLAKVAPSHQHTDLERKMRDVTQLNIRNTALRYKFATITQKFGSYQTYWKRTLREIESGRYIRNLTKLKRQAEQYGGEIPEEILAAMPKMMRDQVKRDRANAVKLAERRGTTNSELDGAASADAAEADLPLRPFASDGDDADEPTGVHAAPPAKAVVRDQRKQVHALEADDDFDVDAMFAAIGADDEPAPRPKPAPAPAPAPRPSQMPVRMATVLGTGEAPPRPAAPRPAPAAPPAEATPPAAARPAMKPIAPPAAAAARIAAVTRPSVPSIPAIATAAPGPTPAIPAPAATVPGGAATRAMPAVGKPPAPVRPSVPAPRPTPATPGAPPPGMSEADVRALYAKYTKARELVGEKNDDQTYAKLMKTLQQQAPKIMQQHKAQGVEFGVVIKDNQVILKAKPKP